MKLIKIVTTTSVALAVIGCSAGPYRDQCSTSAAAKHSGAVASLSNLDKRSVIQISLGTLEDTVPATKVLIDKKLICELGSSKVCSSEVEAGCHEVTLNNPLDLGNFSRRYLFEGGKTYVFNADTNWDVVVGNAVGDYVPLGLMLAPRGDDAKLLLILKSIKKTGEK
jgi:hypothetical protein